jgi:hypothetical protein
MPRVGSGCALSLISVLDEGGCSTPCPDHLIPGIETPYPWGGAQGGSGRVRLRQGWIPVASRRYYVKCRYYEVCFIESYGWLTSICGLR